MNEKSRTTAVKLTQLAVVHGPIRNRLDQEGDLLLREGQAVPLHGQQVGDPPAALRGLGGTHGGGGGVCGVTAERARGGEAPAGGGRRRR